MKRKDFILISALIMAGAPLTGKAQLSKSALDYMLQRPQVTKSYKDKKFMDHLFMDFKTRESGDGFLQHGVLPEQAEELFRIKLA